MNTIPKLPLRYNDGKLFWTENRGGGVKAGDEAGTLHSTGYVCFRFTGIDYRAHRVVWVMHYGPIPDNHTVDHINRIKTDNRIENLRLAANQTEQNGNRLAKGFSYHKLSGKFQARIYAWGKYKYLGLHNTELDARAEYIRSHREIHGDFSPYNNWEMQK